VRAKRQANSTKEQTNITMAEGYCVKCKAKREMSNAKEVEMKGKGGKVRAAMTGICPTCGTKMFKIMGLKK
jgi:Zn finger protein HypA/HybF involved in hydrogenase expression